MNAEAEASMTSPTAPMSFKEMCELIASCTDAEGKPIDIVTFNKESPKKLGELHFEIQLGETTLTRLLHKDLWRCFCSRKSVKIELHAEGFKLYEIQRLHTLGAGFSEEVNLDHISETMLPRETPLQTAQRGLRQELKLFVTSSNIDFDIFKHRNATIVRESKKFLGLVSCAEVIFARAQIAQRPFDTFRVGQDGETFIVFEWRQVTEQGGS